MKFGMPLKNHMPMVVKGSKSKPEVEFQDGDKWLRIQFIEEPIVVWGGDEIWAFDSQENP